MKSKPITNLRLYIWTIKHLEIYVTWLEVAKHEHAYKCVVWLNMYRDNLKFVSLEYMLGSPIHADSPTNKHQIRACIRHVRDARALLYTGDFTKETRALRLAIERTDILNRMNSHAEVSMMEALTVTPIYGTHKLLELTSNPTRRNSFDP